jgi:hypothetical protein
VHLLGDIHLGTAHCAEDKIKARVQQIKDDPFALWIGMGDYCEFISARDPRFDGKCISNWIDPAEIGESEIEKIVNLFQPIRSKCIGLLMGNHEDAYRKHQDGDPQKQICKRLNLPDLGYSAFVRLIFRRKSGNCRESHEFLGVVTHGAGGGITRGAKMTRLERFMDNFNARWYAHGHVHDTIISTKHYMELTEAGKIISLEKIGAMTGCWFRGYTQGIPPSYGEIKNYPPNGIGAPVFVFDPDENKVTVNA